jgi:hypothetical protein
MSTIQDQAAAAYEAGGPEAYDDFLSANGLQVFCVTHSGTGEFLGEFIAANVAGAIVQAVKAAGYDGDEAEAAMFADELAVEP